MEVTLGEGLQRTSAPQMATIVACVQQNEQKLKVWNHVMMCTYVVKHTDHTEAF